MVCDFLKRYNEIKNNRIEMEVLIRFQIDIFDGASVFCSRGAIGLVFITPSPSNYILSYKGRNVKIINGLTDYHQKQ